MDGSGYYSRGFNDFRRIQTTSSDGALGNTNHDRASGAVQNSQALQQALSINGTGYHSNKYRSDLHQQSASINPSYEYIQHDSGQYARSHQQPSSSTGLTERNVYPCEQFAPSNGSYDHVFPHSHRQSGSGWHFNGFDSCQPPQSLSTYVSQRNDLPQSMVTGSHVSANGRGIQLTSSTMNCSQNTPQGMDQFGYANLHAEYNHSMNYSSAPITDHPKNDNSNNALSFTSPACYRSQFASNNANHGYDLPQSMITGSHVSSHRQCSQLTSSTMHCPQYTPQRLDQLGCANLHGEYSHSMNYFSGPITGHSKNDDSYPSTSSASPAVMPSHVTERSRFVHMTNGSRGNQMLRQGIAVQTYHDLNNAGTGCAQSNSSQPNISQNGIYSSLGEDTSCSQTSSNAALTDSEQVARQSSVVSCHSFFTAPSVTDSKGVSTPGCGYVSPSIKTSSADGGTTEYSRAGNSGSLSAEDSRCIAPQSAFTSHSGFPRKDVSTTPNTPANVNPAVSEDTASTTKIETSNSHADASKKSLTKPAQSAPAKQRKSKNMSNARQANTHAKASKTIAIKSSTHAECPKSTMAGAGAVVSRKRRVLPKSISIPTEFSPRHSYRAAAAYSLLRTLSKELRLSPFSMQSFLSSLMLPIPSRLLGEIHVRILRVLFANVGKGSYSKYGRGDAPIFLRTKRTNPSERGQAIEDESMEPIGEFVTERGCNNLFYLDITTWPLFYEDYVIATEDKFIDDTRDDDAFIDIRSSAMVPSGAWDAQFNTRQYRNGANINKPSNSDIVPYPGEGWIDRCPLGPFGRRNDVGRFICCPFHIHVAINMARQCSRVPLNTSVGSHPEASTANKRKRLTPTTKPKSKKDSLDASSLKYDDSESETEFDDFKFTKVPTGVRRRGRPRKFPNSEPRSAASSIKGSRVIDVQIAPSFVRKSANISALPKKAVARPQQASASDSVSIAALSPNLGLSRAKGDHNIVPNQIMSAMSPKPPLATPPHSLECIPASHSTNSSGLGFPPVFVPPIPPQPMNDNALVVPIGVKKTLTRFFSEGDLFRNNSKDRDSGNPSHHNSSPYTSNQLNDDGIVESIERKIDADEVEIWDLVNQISQSPWYPDEDSSHMTPIRQLRKGMPYHYLSLESKLAMIEFLLDELLTVDEISKELTLRHQLTGQYDFLYGPVPQQCEFEDINNEDECSICGLEGDLLCCDGCPGSFHRQCLGMAPSGKLPQGKWLCTECRVPDSSKLGPLGSDNRPLIGWFTLDELEATPQPITTFDNSSRILSLSPPELSHAVVSSQQNIVTYNCSKSSGNPALQPQDFCRLLTVTPQIVVADNANSDLSTRIPVDVEFLVSPGKVFARYRSSHRKFNPFVPCPIESSALTLTRKFSRENLSHSKDQLLLSRNPPEPLSNSEVMELIRLLGPEMCLRLPWRCLIFDPQKVFRTGDHSITLASSPNNISHLLDSLISHQNEKKEMLTNHPDAANPLDYDNKYRRAPPIPKIKHQLGQFTFPTVVPEMITFPAKCSAQLWLSLSNAVSLDSTMDIFPNLSMPFPDVMQSIRDTFVKTGRLLYDGCLLDYRWGTLDRWRGKVQNANSFSQLCILLVKLADACCPRAFHRQWYEVRENGNIDETTRLASNGRSSFFSRMTEGWTPDRESRRRRWERCTAASVFHLLNNEKISTDTDIFKNCESTTKRSKKYKLSCAVLHCANNRPNSKLGTLIDENQQMAKDQQSEVEVTGVFRGGCTTIPVANSPKNEVEPKSLIVSKAPSSSVGVLTPSTPNLSPQDEPIPSVDVEKVEECRPISEPVVSIKSELSSPPIIPGTKKSTSIVDVSSESPICEAVDPNSSLLDNSEFSESREMSTQPISNATKKRRKTRESSIAPIIKKRRSDCQSAVRLQIGSLLGLDTAKTSHGIDREIAEIKVDKLEKLLTETDDSFFFSIAGRKLFQPDGSIPSQIVRRLARNAGSARAPFIAYETSFEVGECTTCHQWRKSTLNGTTFEDFVFSLRFFEGHLDKVVVSSCGGIADQASKSNPTTTTSAIRCEQIDQITGINEYFVVDSEKNQGMWHSELNLDLATLITHRFEKISLARENAEKVQKAQENEKKRIQMERERLETEKKKVQIEKRQKELLRRMAQNNKGKATSSKDKAIKNPAKPAKQASEAKSIVSESSLLSFDAALNIHRDLTLNLLVTSANRGEASVPVAAITATRNTTMMNMKATNDVLRSTGKALTDDQIKNKMTLAESAAVQTYIKEMHTTKKSSV